MANKSPTHEAHLIGIESPLPGGTHLPPDCCDFSPGKSLDCGVADIHLLVLLLACRKGGG